MHVNKVILNVARTKFNISSKLKYLVLNFNDNPTEENAYEFCRHYKKTIPLFIKNPTDNVRNYHKLFWS